MATLPSNSMLDYFHLKLIICYSRLAYSFLLQLHFYKSKTLKKASDTKLQHNYVVLLGNGFLMKNSGNEATFVCAPPLVCTVCYWYKAMAEKLQWVLSIRRRRGSSLITAGWWWGGSLSNLSDSWETLCHILSLSLEAIHIGTFFVLLRAETKLVKPSGCSANRYCSGKFWGKVTQGSR